MEGGVFMYPVSEANRRLHCLELKAYDYMLRFEKSFNEFEGNAWAFLELFCKACGVEMEMPMYLHAEAIPLCLRL
nr:hypothetical protein [uncultured Acetatifactor sp.]